jgi:outer membrane murein-binding lipoprotein Lpp
VKSTRIVAIAVAAALLAGCAFQNKYEKEADKITHAVMANDLSPIKDEIAPRINITRVQVAEWSDELSQQGKLESVKETTDNCPGGTHCFVVKFEKGTYAEQLRLDDRDKITFWHFQRLQNAG